MVTMDSGQLGPIRQLAFVVDDVERTALSWAEVFGAGPFFVFDVDMPATTFRGASSHLRSRMALGQLADQQIELIQPLDDTPTVYSEFLARGGTGVHHVCYWYDVDAANEMLIARGHELVQDGLTGGGDRFSYLAAPFGPPYVEVVDPSGGSGSMATFFAAVAGAASGWDGSDPVRRR